MWHVGIYGGAVVAAVVVLCLVHREWKVGWFSNECGGAGWYVTATYDDAVVVAVV